MSKKYDGLYSLMNQDKKAHEFFMSLPQYVQDQISQRPQGVNSFESLRSYADNLLRGSI